MASVNAVEPALCEYPLVARDEPAPMETSPVLISADPRVSFLEPIRSREPVFEVRPVSASPDVMIEPLDPSRIRVARVGFDGAPRELQWASQVPCAPDEHAC